MLANAFGQLINAGILQHQPIAQAIHINLVGLDVTDRIRGNLAQRVAQSANRTWQFCRFWRGRGGGRALLLVLWWLIEDVSGHQRRPHAIWIVCSNSSPTPFTLVRARSIVFLMNWLGSTS